MSDSLKTEMTTVTSSGDSGRSWLACAHYYDDGPQGRCFYAHIGARRWVELHGLKREIVDVKITEDPQGDYWGWLATDETRPSMIWASLAQFRICFPYGPEAEVQRGKGVILRLRVEKAAPRNELCCICQKPLTDSLCFWNETERWHTYCADRHKRVALTP